jgi:hypothetical protein
MTSVRTDIHRPSAIQPEEYQFVGIWFDPGAEHVVGGHKLLADESERITEFMDEHGAQWSAHSHGGSCQCCGAHALYLAAFYHEHHNEMIRVGERCAEKIGMGCDAAFTAARKKVASAREHATGKARAKLQLQERDLEPAWELYEAKNLQGHDNLIAFDLVGKLIRYGAMSEKQWEFLKRLMFRIENRETIETQKAAEKAAALDCPKGRMEITGTVLSTKISDGIYGSVLKMLVKVSDGGYTVYGTVPSGLEVEKGKTVTFKATVEPSDKDSKHGYFSRPSAQKKKESFNLLTQS